MTTLAIYDCPLAAGTADTSRLRRAIQRTVDFKRNPRSAAYMSALASHVGRDTWTVVQAGAVTDAEIAQASQLVLLWPDANGFGWSQLSRRVFRQKRSDARVSVLNGRGRFFELTPSARRRFAVRRLIQRTWVGEAAFMIIGLAISIPLAAWDAVRGRV